MRVLVYEFLCGGGWGEAPFPPSLIREGAAMLQGLLEDFARIPEVTVVSTWDERLSAYPPIDAKIEWHPIHAPGDDVAVLTNVGRTVDLAIVVAPEFQNELRNRCRLLRELGVPLLNCDDKTIHLCSDKLKTFQFCIENKIPTIPTQLATVSPEEFPCIVKLRDGAGCQQMERLTSLAGWNQWSQRVEKTEFLVQPELSGLPCSVGVIFRAGKVVSVLPVAEQILSLEREICYLGGRIPAPSVQRDGVVSLIHKVAAALPGLNGYVGFDFLLNPSQLNPSQSPILVEINPRVCTSYVGYRRLTEYNLAHLLAYGEEESEIPFTGSVTFQADGTVFR